jgi:hypothetical protein
MNTDNNQPGDRDEHLWKQAKKRVEFKKHLLTYLIVNAFLWAIWIYGGLQHGDFNFPWPGFVTFGWGIGILFNYIGAYSGFKDTMTEKEYQKLMNNKN